MESLAFDNHQFQSTCTCIPLSFYLKGSRWSSLNQTFDMSTPMAFKAYKSLKSYHALIACCRLLDDIFLYSTTVFMLGSHTFASIPSGSMPAIPNVDGVA